MAKSQDQKRSGARTVDDKPTVLDELLEGPTMRIMLRTSGHDPDSYREFLKKTARKKLGARPSGLSGEDPS